jgi:hypothetical protein
LHNTNAPRAPHSQIQTHYTALAYSVPPPPALAANIKDVHQLSGADTSNVRRWCVDGCAVGISQNKFAMHPTGQARQWHVDLQGNPRASVTDRPRMGRRFQGSTFRQESDGRDPWPQRATLPLERRCDESSNSDVPWWRTRLERNHKQDELREPSVEGGVNRPPAPQPARRWSTPDPSTPPCSYGFGLRRPWARQHDTHANHASPVAQDLVAQVCATTTRRTIIVTQGNRARLGRNGLLAPHTTTTPMKTTATD